MDVQQKVPISPNQESLSHSYLQDIYAIALNVTYHYLTQRYVSETWIRKATEDDLASKQAIEKIYDV